MIYSAYLESRGKECLEAGSYKAQPLAIAAKLQALFFSLLCLTAIALFCIPATYAYADDDLWVEQTIQIGDVTYTYYLEENNTVSIAGISTTASKVTVPEKIDGYYVSNIYAEDSNEPDSTPTISANVVSLDVTGCSALEGLYCTHNNLTSLNVKGLSKLTSLYCQYNKLSELDLSGLTHLAELYCGNNNLTALNVSSLSNLDAFDCSNNKLTSLNVKGLSKLTDLGCSNNQLTSLDLSNLTNMVVLYCSGNQLASLNLSGLSKLETLVCAKNALTSLDISAFPNLEELDCSDNRISDTSKLLAWLEKHPGSAEDFLNKVLPQNPESTTTPASTTGKWEHNSKGWWYAYPDKTYAKGLTTIGNSTYYFDNSGWMMTGWQKLDKTWYYFGAKNDGAMKTGWEKVSGKWYYMDAEGKMLTGKQTIGEKLYFLDQSGAMRTGWVKDAGSWYYCNTSGAATTGWQKVRGIWYFMNSDYTMATGWIEDGKAKYYTDPSGAMVKGWKKIDNNWYYFTNSGAMKTSAWISGMYWVDAEGIMATDAWVDDDQYYVNAKGEWVPNAKK